MSIARPDEARSELLFRSPMVPLPLGAELTVTAEECAVLHSNGRILGTLGPGQHRLVPQAFPFLGSAIMNGAIDAELWFVTTVPWRGVQFGGSIGALPHAASKIDFETRVFGECTIVVSDPVRLLQACMGQSMEGDAIGRWVGGLVVRKVQEAAVALVMDGMRPLDLRGPMLEERLRGEFPELDTAGLRFVQLGNLSINFSEESMAAYKSWATARAEEKRQEKIAELKQREQAQPEPPPAPPAVGVWRAAPISVPPGSWLAFSAGPLAPNQAVIVPPGYVFCGVVGGATAFRSPPGQYVTPGPCEAGVFVGVAPLHVKMPGKVNDPVTGPRTFHLFAEGNVYCPNASQLASFTDGLAATDTFMLEVVGNAVSRLVDAFVEEHLASRTWSVAALESGALSAQLATSVREAFAARGDCEIDGVGVNLTSMRLTFDPPQHAAALAQGAAAAPAAGTLAVGARVLVQWSDGNRYPGVAQQVAPGQVLVAFPNGQAQWVPAPFVAPV